MSNFEDRLETLATENKITFEDFKPLIDEALTFLKESNDYSTKQTLDALLVFTNIPACMLGKDPCKDANSKILEVDTSQFYSNCEVVGRHLLDNGYCQLVVEIASALQRKLDHVDGNGNGKHTVYQCQANFEMLLNGLLRYTDAASRDDTPICRVLCESGILGALLPVLVYFDNPANQIPKKMDGINITIRTKTAILMTLCNIIAPCPDNRQAYRNADVINILSGIRKPGMEVRILSLFIHAYIVDENENDKLTKSQDCIRFLTEMFTKAVFSSQHAISSIDMGDPNACMVYSARELLDGLNHLAVNDDNKLDIYKHGGVPAIIRMLQPDFSEDERQVAIEAIWNLAFIENIRKNAEVQKAIPTLQQLTRSTNESVREASTYALWEISDNKIRVTEESHQTDSPPSYEESLTKDAASSDTTGGHVMLSYQWTSQETALSIRDTLTSAGYNVWMDVDKNKMSGDTLEAMAKAVDKSSVVVVCVTEEYKDNQCCRSEASYAFKQKKPIIPLLMEAEYKPDGWLGLVLSTNLYYDFCSDDEMTTNMQKLIEAIGDRGRRSKQYDTEGPTPCRAQQAEQQ